VSPPPDTSPGTLAGKLSRLARHHGAIFASPGLTKLVKRDKFGVMMKLSSCDAKIVTSFLLIPAVRQRFLFFQIKQNQPVINSTSF
jgi:hypothetical protein